MSVPISLSDEEYNALENTTQKIQIYAALLGIHPRVDAYVDGFGKPVGTNLLDAIEKVLSRDWQSTRIRTAIWSSTNITEDEKNELAHLVNALESYALARAYGADIRTANDILLTIQESIALIQEGIGRYKNGKIEEAETILQSS